MNFNFCRFSCGRSWHPTRIIRTSKCEWFVVMNDMDVNNPCNYVRIEPAQDLFDNPPDGWLLISNDELVFEHGNAEDALWRVKLLAHKTSCPYVAEHTMYDIQHEQRIDDWKEKESLRMTLIEERMKMHEERENAKTDCQKLP